MEQKFKITIESDTIDSYDGDEHETVTLVTNEITRDALVDKFKTMLTVLGFVFEKEEEEC